MMHFERWSLLILGEALTSDVTRSSVFERNLLIDRRTLKSRLASLVSSGLMDRRASPGFDTDPEFTLTDKGRDLEKVIRELNEWSERWSLPALAEADLSIGTSSDRRGDQGSSAPDAVPIEVGVLGSFSLRVGGQAITGLPLGSQRLLVFLALHDRPVSRMAVAGKMWPDSSQERAGVSLRSALARLDPATRDAINVACAGLALADSATVDLHFAQDLAHRLLLGVEAVVARDLTTAALRSLSTELLTDWQDEWILEDREDWRQLRTTGLEAMSGILTGYKQPLKAAQAARAAIKVEPLRESAHIALVRAHLAHGNRSEAVGAYERYRVLLHDALGIAPSPLLTELVSHIRSA